MCCARASAARARNESAESTASSVTALGSFTAPDYGMSVATDIKARLAALDWPAIEQSLWELGYAKTPPVLTPAECTELIALYADDRRFRSRVEMARYKFGVGDYQYFDAPLPPLVEALRVHAYPPLARSQTGGRPRWQRRRATRPIFHRSSPSAAAAARPSRPRSSSTTRLAATTVSTRTSTATSSSPCSSPGSSPAGVWTTRAASSCWSSNGRAPSHAAKSWRPNRARSSSSRRATDPREARAATTAP